MIKPLSPASRLYTFGAMQPYILLTAATLLWAGPAASQTFVTYEPAPAAGIGKKVVLISGDEEYRHEEGLPMLARILAFRHGFRAVVLFSQNKSTGMIDPNAADNIPGMAQLKDADLMVLGLRWRELPDADMAHFVEYMQSGKPIIGLRTSTHSFRYQKNLSSPYAKYSFRSSNPKGGFGGYVLGTTWIDHHGIFNVRSSMGLIREARKSHPILRGVKDFWMPSDVYKIDPQPADAVPLVDGQVLSGMKATDPPVAGLSTLPIVWTREFKNEKNNDQRVVTITAGAAWDFKSEDLRRLFVNACYWSIGKEASIPEAADVEIFGTFEPTVWGGGKYKQGVKPSDWAMPTPVSILPGPGGKAPKAPGSVAEGEGFRADGKKITPGGRKWLQAGRFHP